MWEEAGGSNAVGVKEPGLQSRVTWCDSHSAFYHAGDLRQVTSSLGLVSSPLK